MLNKVKFAVITSIFLWASAFVGISAGLHDYSPESLALLRFIVASICMGIVFWCLPARSKVRALDVVRMMGAGVIGIGVYNITLNYGELTVPSGIASFIVSQSPIITALIAIPFLGERLTPMRLMGFLVSVLGITLISISQIKDFHVGTGVLFVLAAACSGSAFTILQKPMLKRYHAIEATTYAIWGGTLFLMFYAPALIHDLPRAALSSTLTVVYLGIFPAAVGYMAWGYVLKEVPVARAMSFLYFVPFVATLLGWLLLNEVPTMLSMGGALLAIAGVWLVNYSYRAPALQQAAEAA